MQLETKKKLQLIEDVKFTTQMPLFKSVDR